MLSDLLIHQNAFNMSSGGMKETMSDLERRKFTAEEGVCPRLVRRNAEPSADIPGPSHLTEWYVLGRLESSVEAHLTSLQRLRPIWPER